ncbi:MAG: hypothetical protein PHO93_01635 [Candidatus Saccharimonadaceae bacterium]|jgi:hypothetical protein|nr:hypothetical protein [Candidatus Saccharimonadaceae bacterium]
MKKKNIFKRLAKWLDVIFLIPGMAFISWGVSKIYIPAGIITIGVCLIALAFFIAQKNASEIKK